MQSGIIDALYFFFTKLDNFVIAQNNQTSYSSSSSIGLTSSSALITQINLNNISLSDSLQLIERARQFCQVFLNFGTEDLRAINESKQLQKQPQQQQQQQMEEDNEMPQSFSNLESLTNIIRKLHQTLNKQEKFQLFLSESNFDTLPTLKLITQPFKIKLQRGLFPPYKKKKLNLYFSFPNCKLIN